MDKHKLILPVSILLGCCILGGFYYASQISRQKSIEHQQLVELQQKEKDEQRKKEQEQVRIDTENKEREMKQAEEKAAKIAIEKQLNDCIDSAVKTLEKNKKVAFDFNKEECNAMVEGSSEKAGCIRAVIDSIDKDEATKKEDVNNCYKRFK